MESGEKDTVLQADKSAFKAKKIGGPKNAQKGAPGATGKKDGLQTEGIDFAKKIVRSTMRAVSSDAALSMSHDLFNLAATRQLAPTGKHHRCEFRLL